MLFLVKLVGLLVLGLGIYFVINPNKIKAYFDFWTKGKRIYWGAVLCVLISILFIKASSLCKWDTFIMVVGIVILVKGIILFVAGKDKLDKLYEKWINKPEDMIRRLAVIDVVLGVLILFGV